MCVAVTIGHGISLVHRYQGHPIRIQLEFGNNQSMAVPAITICPSDRFDLVRLNRLWQQHFDPNRSSTLVPDYNQQYHQLADLMDVDILWKKIAYNLSHFLQKVIIISIIITIIIIIITIIITIYFIYNSSPPLPPTATPTC